jgi:hypothetical protein
VNGVRTVLRHRGSKEGGAGTLDRESATMISSYLGELGLSAKLKFAAEISVRRCPSNGRERSTVT